MDCMATPVKNWFDARHGHVIAGADILEDPLLQETSERPKEALRAVNKAQWFQNTV